MLLQWRAGLRVSEALAVERRDLSLNVERPTRRVRRGQGYRARVVPVHPELDRALAMYCDMLPRGYGGPLVDGSRQGAWHWVKQAAAGCQGTGQLAPGRQVKTHTLRHSYTRHLLLSGIPINYLSCWLGHANLAATLIYLDLLPDPTGSLSAVP